jgi:hypothetical protein
LSSQLTKGGNINQFEYLIIEGEKCVNFLTEGKYQGVVLVDADAWEKYLCVHHWTLGINRNDYPVVHTSINKRTVILYRLIVENEFSELDYWGKTIDHDNNNPLDNRKKNLIFSTPKLNATNILSKYKKDDLHMIFKQHPSKNKGRISGYKVHANIFDEVKYKNFKSIEEAKRYRDDELIPYIETRIKVMEKKNRDIEFERGLRDKIDSNEIDEIIIILKKYGLLIS